MNSKELREKRAVVGKNLQRMADIAEQREFTAEERAEFDRINADYDALTQQIDVVERSELVARQQAEPSQRGGGNLPGRENRSIGGDEHRSTGPESMAIAAWSLRMMGRPLRAEHERAAQENGVDLNSPWLDLRLAPTGEVRLLQRSMEQRALSAVTGSAGAYTIQEDFMASLERAMLAFGGPRNVAQIIRTTTGADMPWPTSNDTSNIGSLVGENTTVGEAGTTFGAMIMRAYKYTSNLIKVPVELLEDSAIDLASVLGSMLGERIGRIQGTHFTTGTGAGQPRGIVTAAALGVTTVGATAIKADEVIDLIHSVDLAYRSNPGTGFMLHDGILQHSRKLKDGQGQYLYQPGNQAGQPDRLHGYPFQINQHMQATVATGTKTMLFGDLGRYKIRDVNVIRVRRLVERFADSDQEGFVSFMRSDGNLLDAGGSPVKYMVQA